MAVGVCLKEQLIDNFPVEPHDRKLDFILCHSCESRNPGK
ncbi:5-formyltetrahydrofolate cyclo-ligase family protein [Rickettsia felis str. Pedreira]|uniref:5-formyltetrahydrofolate cyclo-ligase family protein n=1 Tax=Rickettsia felis str. Pedreira TaxID=1359196 RepID=A0A0F3MUB1_RICFI|nr:5-formyltetrahydrofolate cyclo-ligase family protein [Rickettsia felis str. Pedreira]